MAVTLDEYAAWLDDRKLRWPVPPAPTPAKANPFVQPLDGIRAVTWSIYGTLLNISDGRLYVQHPQQVRMQVALERTIEEFNMWYSMTRKPGAPWEYMLQKYDRFADELRMISSGRKGDVTEVNSTQIWRRVIGMLAEKEYAYDEKFYGDLDDLSEKVAFFFHSCLQGVAAMPNAAETVSAIADAGIMQGLLSDAQPFTLMQMLRALDPEGKLRQLGSLLLPGCNVLSFEERVRQPSFSLYEKSLRRFQDLGVESRQILHVGSRIRDDLAVARQFGFRTALYVGDKCSLQATAAELKDPTLKPDRLLTDLGQIRRILTIE